MWFTSFKQLAKNHIILRPKSIHQVLTNEYCIILFKSVVLDCGIISAKVMHYIFYALENMLNIKYERFLLIYSDTLSFHGTKKA